MVRLQLNSPGSAADLACDCLGVSGPVPPAILSPVPRSDRKPGRATVTLSSMPPKRAAQVAGGEGEQGSSASAGRPTTQAARLASRGLRSLRGTGDKSGRPLGGIEPGVTRRGRSVGPATRSPAVPGRSLRGSHRLDRGWFARSEAVTGQIAGGTGALFPRLPSTASAYPTTQQAGGLRYR